MCTSFLTILGDDIIEPTERILITLTTVNTDVVIGGSTFITVLDDDREFPVPFVMGFPLYSKLANSQAVLMHATSGAYVSYSLDFLYDQ